VLDLGSHREIPGNAVTPWSSLQANAQKVDRAIEVRGVFCAATHYWELGAGSRCEGDPTVGEHLLRLIERATRRHEVVWESVGDTVAKGSLMSGWRPVSSEL
jgi:hypothetical protein